MKEYEMCFKKIILNLLAVTIVLFIFFYLNNEKINWEIQLLICFLMIFGGSSVYFIRKRLYKLRIDTNSNTVFLFYRKYFFVEYSEAVLFDSLLFSNKEEVGAQGVRAIEFRIYVESKKLFGLDCTIDGWEKKTVDEIVSKFRELGLNEIK